MKTRYFLRIFILLFMTMISAFFSWSAIDATFLLNSKPHVFATIISLRNQKDNIWGILKYNITENGKILQCNPEVQIGPSRFNYKSGQNIKIYLRDDRCVSPISPDAYQAPYFTIGFTIIMIGVTLINLIDYIRLSRVNT